MRCFPSIIDVVHARLIFANLSPQMKIFNYLWRWDGSKTNIDCEPLRTKGFQILEKSVKLHLQSIARAEKGVATSNEIVEEMMAVYLESGNTFHHPDEFEAYA